jgi:Arc/MetJ family transcription regulator
LGVRTNIDIDDDLLAAAQHVAGTSTKKATVEAALHELVRRHDRMRVSELLGAVEWQGDLDESRESRTA